MSMILAPETATVNPASIEAALLDSWLADVADRRQDRTDLAIYEAQLDAAYDAWLDAHAVELAADSESDAMVESGAWAW